VASQDGVLEEATSFGLALLSSLSRYGRFFRVVPPENMILSFVLLTAAEWVKAAVYINSCDGGGNGNLAPALLAELHVYCVSRGTAAVTTLLLARDKAGWFSE
jgi:hypothetical protein